MHHKIEGYSHLTMEELEESLQMNGSWYTTAWLPYATLKSRPDVVAQAAAKIPYDIYHRLAEINDQVRTSLLLEAKMLVCQIVWYQHPFALKQQMPFIWFLGPAQIIPGLDPRSQALLDLFWTTREMYGYHLEANEVFVCNHEQVRDWVENLYRSTRFTQGDCLCEFGEWVACNLVTNYCTEVLNVVRGRPDCYELLKAFWEDIKTFNERILLETFVHAESLGLELLGSNQGDDMFPVCTCKEQTG